MRVQRYHPTLDELDEVTICEDMRALAEKVADWTEDTIAEASIRATAEVLGSMARKMHFNTGYWLMVDVTTSQGESTHTVAIVDRPLEYQSA